jgi:amino acid adenylation domain-containing protein
MELKTISSIIFERCMKTPDKTALILDDSRLSYVELLNRSNYVSLVLKDRYNIMEGDIVIQCLERCEEMVIGMIAIVSIGAVYFPVHPDEPIERLNLLIENTNCKLVLTTSEFRNKITRTETYSLDCTEQNSSSFCDVYDNGLAVAYMISTSGSTGNPKIISIQHKALLNYTESMSLSPYNWDDNMLYLQTCRCSFDVHIHDIFCTLMFGSTVVMLNRNSVYDPTYFHKTVLKHNVSHMTLVPSLIQILTIDNCKNWDLVKKIYMIGEQLTVKHLNQLKKFSNALIYNMYGPAECTIAATGYLVDSCDYNKYAIPIGKPLYNYKCFVLNTDHKEVATNEKGELYIGGKGLMLEYYKNPEQTCRNLIFSTTYNEMMYKTGDIVYTNDCSNLVFVGRTDFQIKIRGQRLEIDEIESVIMKDERVDRCYITKSDMESGEHLVAYIMSNIPCTDKFKTELSDICKQYLRTYMIPSIWIIMKEFPLNANGKIDVKKLPLPTFNTDEYRKPESDMECFVVKSLNKIFPDKLISMNDDIFNNLGVTSILLIKFISFLKENPAFKAIQLVKLFSLRKVCQISAYGQYKMDTNK